MRGSSFFRFCFKIAGFLLCGSVAVAQVYYSHEDHLGSTVLWSGQEGGVRQRGDYAPFGEIFQSVSLQPVIPSRYTGQELDEGTGLQEYGARYQDPVTVRFMSRDPLETHPPYSYVLNNPVRYTDPRGLEEEEKSQPSPPSWWESLQNKLDELGVTFPGFSPSGGLPAVPNSWGENYNASAPSLPFFKGGLDPKGALEEGIERAFPPYYGVEVEAVTKKSIGEVLGSLFKISFRLVPRPLALGEFDEGEDPENRYVSLMYRHFYNAENPDIRRLRTDIFNYRVGADPDLAQGSSVGVTVHDPLGVDTPQQFGNQLATLVKNLHQDIGRYREDPSGLQGDVQARLALSIAERLKKLGESVDGN